MLNTEPTFSLCVYCGSSSGRIDAYTQAARALAAAMVERGIRLVYGGASVLGVPFALAMLGQNQIIVLTALSLIGAMGNEVHPLILLVVIGIVIMGVFDM